MGTSASLLLKKLIVQFIFQAGGPCEDDYPPLPVYQYDSEEEKKEVYIVQVKGFPWSCSAEDLLHFFSGESRCLFLSDGEDHCPTLRQPASSINCVFLITLPPINRCQKCLSAVQTVQHNRNIFTVYILK